MGGYSSKRSALARNAPQTDGLANTNDIALQSKYLISVLSNRPIDLLSELTLNSLLQYRIDIVAVSRRRTSNGVGHIIIVNLDLVCTIDILFVVWFSSENWTRKSAKPQ